MSFVGICISLRKNDRMEKKNKTSATKTNHFFDLEESLKGKIYEFDSTYREKFTDCLRNLPEECICSFDLVDRMKMPDACPIYRTIEHLLIHDHWKISMRLFVKTEDGNIDSVVLYKSCAKHACVSYKRATQAVLRLHGRLWRNMEICNKQDMEAAFQRVLNRFTGIPILMRPKIDIILSTRDDFTKATFYVTTGYRIQRTLQMPNVIKFDNSFLTGVK